jgi:ABC-type Mn2+/Zn2+ transport system ATPase subunit
VDIQLKNCNNIDTGIVNISKSKLNIKFGINGTGKSTIAKAIKYGIESPEKLNELIPFKLKNASSNNKPEVTVSEEIKSVFIFNEEYLNQFVYKEDELISNSFEIFIKTPKYVESVQEIETILEDIKKVFQEDENLNKIIEDFESLSKSFTITKTGKLSVSSPGYKALEKGNLLNNIPLKLQEYGEFITNKERCIDWLGWQIKGKSFMDISDKCPFCTSMTEDKKEIIKSISETYDKNLISKLIVIIDALNNLGDYLSYIANKKLREITTKNTGFEKEEITYLQETTNQIDIFLDKLKKLQLISVRDLAGNDEVEKQIKSLEIKLDYLDKINSPKSQQIADSLNSSLDEVLKKITDLKRAIGQQKSEIRSLIAKHQKNINHFFKKSGYKYEVIITDENKDYKLRLKHIDADEKILRGNQYLSFGEKNAFALVLFMYEALSKNPDLIILDDPISSFDKHKKYAIMEMLFREDNSFKGKTVLMLTHDIEPIIDVVKVLHHKFSNLTNSCFINIKDNQIKELGITKNDLLSFSQICKKVIGSNSINEIVKLIYLRRYYESTDDKCDEYEVLSNLLHKRTKEEAIDQRKGEVDNESQKLSEEDFKKGVEEIIKKFTNFDYDSLLETIKNNSKILGIYNRTDDSFVKIILFRILIDGIEKDKKPEEVFMKFINEVYHIENDFLFQLNPKKFDITPQFIIDGCNDFVKTLEEPSSNE